KNPAHQAPPRHPQAWEAPPTRQRFEGFFRSALFGYLAGGIGWTLAGIPNAVATLQVDALLGPAFVGFTFAGLIHFGAYFIPGALLWTFLRPGHPLTRWHFALPTGFLIGTLPFLFVQPAAALLVGLVYGVPTAAINLLVYQRLPMAKPGSI
ncbi:MAG: hypothetical protein AAF191_14615, partial [Verrucomicrobiota bacterium]